VDRHPRIADSRSCGYRAGPTITSEHTNRDADETDSRVANNYTTRISDRTTCRAGDDTATAGQRYQPPWTTDPDTDGKSPNSHARRDGLVGIVLDSRCRPPAIIVSDRDRHSRVRPSDGDRLPLDDATRDGNDADSDHAKGFRARYCDRTRLPDRTADADGDTDARARHAAPRPGTDVGSLGPEDIG